MYCYSRWGTLYGSGQCREMIKTAKIKIAETVIFIATLENIFPYRQTLNDSLFLTGGLGLGGGGGGGERKKKKKKKKERERERTFTPKRDIKYWDLQALCVNICCNYDTDVERI